MRGLWRGTGPTVIRLGLGVGLHMVGGGLTGGGAGPAPASWGGSMMCAGLEWGCSGGRLLPGYIVWTNPHLDVQRSCPQVLVENLKGGLSKQLDSGLFHLSSFNALLSGGTREWWYEGGVGEGELLSMRVCFVPPCCHQQQHHYL